MDIEMPEDDRLEGFLRALPKAELHLHLEGSVPWELVRSWSRGSLPERPPWWAHEHRFLSFGEFVTAIRPTWRPYLTSPERIAETAEGIFFGLMKQNVRYVELSFGLGAYTFPAAEVVSAIKGAAPADLAVRVFAGISRDRDLEAILALAREAVRAEGLDGIDLHGDERAGNLSDFAGIYHEAQERGLMTKAHAGELDGPDAVRRTVEELDVSRIEHGITAVRDGEVMRFLHDRGVALDLCPWSNVKLRVVPDLRTHPLKALHRAGVCVTVSTDDPTAFGQTLTDELRWLATEMGLSVSDVAEIAGNGFRVALLPGDERERYLKAIAECGKRDAGDGETDDPEPGTENRGGQSQVRDCAGQGEALWILRCSKRSGKP